MMLLKKLLAVITKVKEDIEEIVDLIPEDKQKIIRDLIIKAAIAYGEAKLREVTNEKL